WNPVESPVASSLGSEAELVIYLARVVEDAALELSLSAPVVGANGHQSTTVSLNGRTVATFDVGVEPAVYTLPLREAVRGRNRVGLKFASPAARRTAEDAWWRKLEGNPVLAIDAHTLWLRAGSPQVHDFSIAGPGAVRCDGCYEVEAGQRRPFRW